MQLFTNPCQLYCSAEQVEHFGTLVYSCFYSDKINKILVISYLCVFAKSTRETLVYRWNSFGEFVLVWVYTILIYYSFLIAIIESWNYSPLNIINSLSK